MGLFDFFKRHLNKNTSSVSSTNSRNKSGFSNTIIQNNSIVDPLLKKKISNGLLPGEIILINWISGKSEPFNFPRYFEYTYGINAYKTLSKLIKNDYFEIAYISRSLSSYTVQQLKNKLKEKSLKSSGNKIELVSRLKPALNDEEIHDLKKFIFYLPKAKKQSGTTIT